MVLHNPNNWHWVNKDVSPWTKAYLEKDLVGIKAEGNGASAEVSKLLSMDGDVDVSQRKGKVITIFDVRLQLEYTGTTADGKDVSGTITIPEVAHDTDEDEYVVCIWPFPLIKNCLTDLSLRLRSTRKKLPRLPSRIWFAQRSLLSSARSSKLSDPR